MTERSNRGNERKKGEGRDRKGRENEETGDIEGENKKRRGRNRK